MMAENYFLYGKMEYRQCQAIHVRFLENPPDDLRKSNFFKFSIQLSILDDPLLVEKAVFEKFLHERDDDTRNGILYSVRIKYGNGRDERRYLYLTLVDAATHEPIRYEGHDDSPKMQRVLLTHEAVCTRCSQQKSCGNKSEAPSDPRILEKGTLQFFLKCNQNCLKGAGNPRDMRRFALAVSFEDVTYDSSKITALSEKIFVHNNSKHSRKRRRDVEIKQEVQPIPLPNESMYIYPKVGMIDASFCFNSREWCKPNVSFRCAGVELPITSMIYQVAMTVQLPISLCPGRIFLTLFFHNSPVFTFPYEVRSRFFGDVKALTCGFLMLLHRDDPNGYDAHSGPVNSAVYVMDGMPHESYFYQTGPYAAVPFNCQINRYENAPNPNYANCPSSPSSTSGSHVSDDSTAYMPSAF